MADISQTNFSMQPQVPLAGIAELYQRKAEAEQQMKVQQEQIAASKQNRMMQTIDLASTLVGNMVAYSAKRQQQQTVQAYNDLMHPNDKPAQAAVDMAYKLNPEATGKQIATELFPKPQEPAHFLPADIVNNGVHTAGGYNPETNQYFAAGETKTPLTGDTTKYTPPNQRAQQYGRNIDYQTADRMDKDLNPAKIPPNTLAGQAIKNIYLADAFTGQLDNIVTGKTIPNSQVMTDIANAANSVISRGHVTTEGLRHGLTIKTIQSKLADLKQYVGNKPIGQDQVEFLQNLGTEVERQRAQSDAVVSKAMRGSLGKYSQFANDNPDLWAETLKSNGFDPDQAKKGKLVLRKGFSSSLYGDTGYEVKESAGQQAAAVDPRIHAIADFFHLPRKGVQ